jgi:hypothetical protein
MKTSAPALMVLNTVSLSHGFPMTRIRVLGEMVLIEEFAPVYKMYIVTEDRRWLFSPYYSSIAEANNFLLTYSF